MQFSPVKLVMQRLQIRSVTFPQLLGVRVH